MLEIRDLSVKYGGTQVLWDVSLDLAAGEMVAVMGPNGSGKSTIFKALMGLAPVSGGSIRLDGQNIAKRPTHQMARLGISLVLERRRLFPAMTVHENLLMGAFTERRSARVLDSISKIYSKFPLLQEKSGDLAGSLSGGQQQLVAIGRGLMSNPRLLILDEPFLGLSPTMVRQIMQTMKDVNAEGVAVLFNEQNARVSFENSHRGYLLQSGRVVLSGSGVEMLDAPEIKRVYLGGGAA